MVRDLTSWGLREFNPLFEGTSSGFMVMLLLLSDFMQSGVKVHGFEFRVEVSGNLGTL